MQLACRKGIVQRLVAASSHGRVIHWKQPSKSDWHRSHASDRLVSLTSDCYGKVHVRWAKGLFADKLQNLSQEVMLQVSAWNVQKDSHWVDTPCQTCISKCFELMESVSQRSTHCHTSIQEIHYFNGTSKSSWEGFIFWSTKELVSIPVHVNLEAKHCTISEIIRLW